ncbi:hypothetical protein KC845_02260 [Candidatus Kaiserbacteria bacterium]|nr:hypothetical protein [Candidatus Kaiserbacteria bacterium]
MRNTAVTQVALIIISVVIIVSYIRPTFANIRVVQDEIYEYADATEKANQFNTRLQQLLLRESEFSNADIKALETFLPSKIEPFAVMDDVQILVEKNGGKVVDMTAGEVILPNPDVDFDDYYDEQAVTANKFVSQTFELSMISDYQGFIGFLRDLESTSYILEITNLSFGSDAEQAKQFDVGANPDEIEFELILKTYALSSNQ